MEEEAEEFCNNCKRNICATNFASHSAFCHRHITVCKICDESVPKNEFEEHEQEYHVSVICDKCYISLQKWMLPKHQEECVKRRVVCEFCEGDFSFDESEDHFEFCGSRTEKCVLCSKYIMLKDNKKHSETCPKRQVICEFCDKDFPFDKSVAHIEFCGTRREQCKLCSKHILLKNKREHFEYHLYKETSVRGNGDGEVDQNRANELISKSSKKMLKSNDKMSGQTYDKKSNSDIANDFDFGSLIGATASVPDKVKQPSSDYTKCHLCRQSVQWTVYNEHMKICAAENGFFTKCLNCHQIISYGDLKEHSTRTCPILTDLKTQANEFGSRTGEHRYLNSHDDLSSKKEFKHLCPLCKKQCSIDELMEHINICPKNNFQCELCYETVLQRDKDLHLSSKCKMLQEKNASVFYECPLCGENLLEKDRTMHESFNCKLLLEANGPVYKLLEEKSRKFCEESKKNLTEIPKYELSCNKKSCSKNCKQCVYCEKMIDVDSEQYHLKNCEVYQQIKEIDIGENTDHRINDHKGAKPKQSVFPKMDKPKVAKCVFCKTTLNENILLFHEKECVHQNIKCPDCPKTVLLKDIDNHNCKSQHKGKNKGRGEKSNQKAEKSESGNGWFSSIFGNYKPSKTYDGYQNDRNELFETHMGNSSGLYANKNAETINQYSKDKKQPYETKTEKKFPSFQDRNTEDLHFAQPVIDDPKIPCEFCGEQFPGSDIVLHMTGCNPEISFPKKEKESDISSKQFKFHDSTGVSKDFFSVDRKALQSARYESIHQRLEHRSEVQPGEYLSPYYSEVSSKSEMSYSDNQIIRKQNQSSSSLEAVWNNDTSDVDMEEIEPETTSSDFIQKMPQKEHSKNSLCETEKRNDSDDEMSSMFEFIEGKTTESSNLNLEKNYSLDERNMQSKMHVSKDSSQRSNIETKIGDKWHDPTKRFVNETYTKKYLSDSKSKHHKGIFFSSDEDEFEETCAPKLDTGNVRTEADRNYKEEEPFRNAFRYILNAEQKSDEVTKETTVNTQVVHNKIKDTENDDDDVLDHIKSEIFHSKVHGNKTESDCSVSERFNDVKKNQTAHNGTEEKSTLDKLQKIELANFRFCGEGRANYFNATEKRQNSDTEKYDLYYKTNALGYVTASEDAQSVIRRPAKKDVDLAFQNNMSKSKNEFQDNITQTRGNEKLNAKTLDVSSLSERPKEMFRSKYEYQDDNTIETRLVEGAESKTQDLSPFIPEKSIEMLRSKYEYRDEHVTEKNETERFKNKIPNVSPCMAEKPFEMSYSKYMYQNQNDSYIQTNQKGKNECRREDISSSMLEKSNEMLQSKYVYQNDSDIQTSQKGKNECKNEDMSPMPEKSNERLKYYTDCPICKETIKWIDLNTHIPTCATASGKCSRCGKKVSSSDLKEHFLHKCPKISEKRDFAQDRSAASLQPRVSSYDQVLKSLTSTNDSERKSRERLLDTRVEISRNEEKMDYTDPNENRINSRAKQAFTIEPADRRGNSNHEENTRSKQLKEIDESLQKFSDVDVDKWFKWARRSSDDN